MTNKCPKCHHDNPDTARSCVECGTQLDMIDKIPIVRTETLETPKEELTRGTTFAGRYEIIEELGKGGMGRVYRVEDTKLEQEVALKLIKPEIAKDKKTIERFRNELKLARNIRHKNVCGMFDLGETKGAHFITMEYVRGEDLRSLIRRIGQLPIGKSISITKQICEGLSEAHRQGVVHRDLKSNNIMIDKEGNVRIMDFGIARSLETKGITGAGVMIGTPEYMSPEQVEGKEVDQRSDIYSLGVILYEMVTGRVPFEGDTPFTIGMKHKGEMPKNPRELNTQISDDLNRLILRCLEKEKDKRYQSVGEVSSELTNIEKGIPTMERVIPERKPLTSREITVQFSIKKIFVPALVFIAIVIIAIVIWQLLPKKDAASIIPSDKPSLAVMYFENNTGDEGLDHWRKALAELLIADLSQSKYITVLSGDRIFNILRGLSLLEEKSYSSEDLKEVAERGGVKNILRGSYTKAGDTIRVNTMLQKADTGELIGSESAEGRGEESFFAMVDDLTKKIKANFKLSSEEIANDNDREVGKITTSYPEAYKYYSEGRKYHLIVDYRQSISFMERAIEIDPEFAMAYRSLGMAHSNMGNIAERIKYLKKSFELSDRTSDKERYWINGDYYRVIERDYDKAIEVYNKLFDLDPDDYVGHHNIALIYNNLEEWDKAIEHLEVNRRNKAEFLGSYTNLGGYYEAKGMYQEAREAYQDYINNFSDNAVIHSYIASSYTFEGRYDLALEEADKAIALDPTISNPKAVIYHLQGDFEAAEKEYRGWLEKDETGWKMYGWRWLEFLYRMLGQYEKAKKEAQAGLKYAVDIDHSNWKRIFYNLLANHDLAQGNLDAMLEKADFIMESAVIDEISGWQIAALLWKIQVCLEQDNIEKALALAEEAKKILDNTPSTKDIRDHLDNLGLIEMKKKNYPKAIDLFTQVYELENSQRRWVENHAYILFNLASAYYLNGDLEMAKNEYENILALTTGRLRDGDLYVKSYYMLGMIHEKQGDTTKAIEHYEKFLDLWKDADPGIVEVEDAKERLAGLK